jgi:hypothetical protein
MVLYFHSYMPGTALPLLACGLRLSDSAVEDGPLLVLVIVVSSAEVAGTTDILCALVS